MTQPSSLTLRSLAAAAFFAAGLAGSVGAQAQSTMSPPSTDSNVPPATANKQAREISQGDPSRWFHEDTSSAAAQRRLRKEIGAALQEAQGACRKLPASERSGCMSEARATYQNDMNAITQK